MSGFNPRARVGRDALLQTLAALQACFNPRARVGRDAITKAARERLSVSIHAPAWGATGVKILTIWQVDCFNPRARVGRDQLVFVLGKQSSLFQSTRPRGARHASGKAANTIDEFQSTRPRGARPSASFLILISIGVSIHAPAWGATLFNVGYLHRTRCFNPRARVGRDLRPPRPVLLFFCFNPRARVGRDLCRSSIIYPKELFQSTRPRGARPELTHTCFSISSVSIHAPAWGATLARCFGTVKVRCFNPRARVGRDAS